MIVNRLLLCSVVCLALVGFATCLCSGSGLRSSQGKFVRELSPSGIHLGPSIAKGDPSTPLLVFSALVDGNWDIYTWDFDSANPPVRRTHTPFDESGPSLSSDRSSCVYETVDGKVWRLQLETGQPAEMLPHASDQAFDMHPAISPDGKSVILATSLNRATDDTDLVVYDLQSGEYGRRLELLAYQHYPSWAPDGKHAAFANLHGRLQTNGPVSEIWVMRTDVPWARQLTMLSAFSVSPAWSPTGDLVAFESDFSGNFDIYVVDPASRAYRRLTNDPAADSDPVFMPDGRSVIFESTRGGSLGLWQFDLESNTVRRVMPFGTASPNICRDPDCK